MPLKRGTTLETISENIAREIESGRKPAQAQAIAFSTARKSAAERNPGRRVPERLKPPGERRRRSNVRTRRRRPARRRKRRRSRVTMR